MADQTQFGQLKRDDSNFPIGWKGAYMSSTGSTVVKSSPGILHTVTLNSGTTGTIINLYDSSSTLTGTFATITGSNVAKSLHYDRVLTSGLVISMTTNNSDITISYI